MTETEIIHAQHSKVIKNKGGVNGAGGAEPQAASVAPSQKIVSADEKRANAIALLRSWREADAEETQDQIETYDFLEKALNDPKTTRRKRI